MELKFWKTQTVGNDFVLIHLKDVVGADLSQLAKQLCERRFGVGADGLLAVEPSPFGMSLRMFNADGTEDFCGNGLRCSALYGFKNQWCGEDFEILHGGQRVPVTVTPGGLVSVTLAPADFAPISVPVHSDTDFVDREVHGVVGTAVSTGSTHFVVLSSELPTDSVFYSLSPLIENDPLFPSKTSIMYAMVAGPSQLRLRIWERGVGETLGCGTGASAAAVVWARKTGFGGEVKVSSPGGDLIVRLRDWQSEITSESRPQEVFEGRLVVESGVLASKAVLT